MNVGCPVRRTVMTFCFCPRFMLEPPSCPASLPTRSFEYLNRYEITKSWQCNYDHAFVLRAFSTLYHLLRPFHAFLGLNVHSLRILSLVYAYLLTFLLIFWSSSLNRPPIPFLSGVCVHLLITSSFRHHIPVTFVTFTTTSLLDAFIFSHGGPWHIK